MLDMSRFWQQAEKTRRTIFIYSNLKSVWVPWISKLCLASNMYRWPSELTHRKEVLFCINFKSTKIRMVSRWKFKSYPSQSNTCGLKIWSLDRAQNKPQGFWIRKTTWISVSVEANGSKKFVCAILCHYRFL